MTRRRIDDGGMFSNPGVSRTHRSTYHLGEFESLTLSPDRQVHPARHPAFGAGRPSARCQRQGSANAARVYGRRIDLATPHSGQHGASDLPIDRLDAEDEQGPDVDEAEDRGANRQGT